ncbi:MAG: L-threonylcarbamoyladenylate synthase [Gammaproteobacteria bacterium]|jgi:L-threonylcarbamoyladenylate synthase
MAYHAPLTRYARILHDGGVIAYPTEGVYGLGCLASRPDAVQRIVELKGRDAGKGLIMIASDPYQLEGWVAMADPEELLRRDGDRARTWIVAAGPLATPEVTGGRPTVAVRVTRHPVAAGLCAAAGEPLISTSANRSGRPAIVRATVLRSVFGPLVDAIVPGALGSAKGPSEIVDFETGRVLRPAAD